MTGWWRRNRLALIALAVLVAVTTATLVGVAWSRYYLYEPTVPVNAAEGETAELADATWGPVRAVDITDVDELPAPSDARVIAVAVPVDPHGDSPSCFSPVLVEQDTGRRWGQMNTALGITDTYEEPSSCTTPEVDENGDPGPIVPYEIFVGYIVPADAEGPFWVEVAEINSYPSFIRFSVEP
ncbi:hypothetical protein ACI7YT_02455 [Microbacterium sp. M]|uniref:hypothetical protein n=1 Tax=Microbacterium sp. M TaxID=3377125 RepID=UPI00386937D9